MLVIETSLHYDALSEKHQIKLQRRSVHGSSHKWSKYKASLNIFQHLIEKVENDFRDGTTDIW